MRRASDRAYSVGSALARVLAGACCNSQVVVLDLPRPAYARAVLLVRRLNRVSASRTAPYWPRVSLIAPARNEERHIEAAVRSLAQLDYPNLEITIINDRSTDRTGQILDSLAAEFPRLNVVHIDRAAGRVAR